MPELTINSPHPQGNRFAVLVKKIFALKNQLHSQSVQSSNSFAEMGSLKEVSIFLSKSRAKNQSPAKQKKSLLSAEEEEKNVDFDLLVLPENSTIAKPSGNKISTIQKKSSILQKNQHKFGSSRPPLNKGSLEKSKEKLDDSKELGLIALDKEQPVVRTRILGK